MAVRRSMGASRTRILRMLAAEGLVLSFAALAAAWCFVLWACRAIVGLLPPANQGFRLEPDFTPDWRVTAYALALAVLSTLAFTIAPAVRAWRQELLPWLKAGEHSVAQGRSALSNTLVVAQIALCVLLLVGAGLAGRSTFLLGGADLHFAKDHLLLVTVNMDGAVSGREETVELLERLRQRLRAVAGVQSASYAWVAPPRHWWSGPVQSAGAARPVESDGNYVGPNYLQALGVPDLVGRGISEQDVSAARKVAVINQSLAEALWPHQSVLGRTLLVGREKQAVEVIGVVPNGAFSSMERDVRPNFIFFPERLNAETWRERTFHVRYAGNLKTVAPAIRAAVREIDARVPISYMRTMQSQLDEDAAPLTIVTSLLSMFSTGALIVAAIGLYAVVAFNTAKRKRDFGVRMALGASSRQILNGVLKDGLVLTAIGLVAGLALSAAAGRAFRSFLAGVSPTDMWTYLGVMSLVAAVSLIACYIPAHRAAGTNPVEALRQE
jgi:putative ABC transport system permease protein